MTEKRMLPPEMTFKMPIAPDYTGHVVVHIENGALIAFYPRRPNEITATLDAFVQMLRRAGWIVRTPEEEEQ
ncbi:hypothetical protein [Serratia marcescens]|uniref:hypothetical protein n=1 Tax=Serratia marcescens TaxID=615 RepID=UPI003982F15F